MHVTVTLLASLATVCLSAPDFDASRRLDLPIQNCAHGGQLVNGECECLLNWSGRTCEEELCKNGGVAKRDREGSLRCACPYGLKGMHCEVPTKCDNGKLVGDKCVCEKGFMGVFCQSRPCYNGVPEFVAESLTCVCDIGYTGSFCEEELECLNEGHVHQEHNVCVCANGFSGDRCTVCTHLVEDGVCLQEVVEEALGSAQSAGTIVEKYTLHLVGAALAVLILMIFVVYLAVRSYNRSKPSRVSSSQGSAIVPNPEGTDV